MHMVEKRSPPTTVEISAHSHENLHARAYWTLRQLPHVPRIYTHFMIRRLQLKPTASEFEYESTYGPGRLRLRVNVPVLVLH